MFKAFRYKSSSRDDEHIDNPEQHTAYFDSHFTSLPLLEELKSLDIKATGTLRGNRLQICKLRDVKDVEKNEVQGFFRTLSTKSQCVARYKDDNVTTVTSKHLKNTPPSLVQRRVKGQKNKITVDQPAMVAD